MGTTVVHGGARGADSIADLVARELGFEVRCYPADWTKHGRAAGPLRNAEMLEREHPDAEGDPINFVLAFSKDFARSRGTADMIKRSQSVGLIIERFSV